MRWWEWERINDIWWIVFTANLSYTEHVYPNPIQSNDDFPQCQFCVLICLFVRLPERPVLIRALRQCGWDVRLMFKLSSTICNLINVPCRWYRLFDWVICNFVECNQNQEIWWFNVWSVGLSAPLTSRLSLRPKFNLVGFEMHFNRKYLRPPSFAGTSLIARLTLAHTSSRNGISQPSVGR